MYNVPISEYRRYYAVCLPLRAGLIWTKNKAGLVCLVSWLLSILLTSPILAIANYKDHATNPRCTTDVDPAWTKAFFLSIISLFFWLPLCVLVFLYAIISSHLTANVNVTKHTGKSWFVLVSLLRASLLEEYRYFALVG